MSLKPIKVTKANVMQVPRPLEKSRVILWDTELTDFSRRKLYRSLKLKELQSSKSGSPFFICRVAKSAETMEENVICRLPDYYMAQSC